MKKIVPVTIDMRIATPPVMAKILKKMSGAIMADIKERRRYIGARSTITIGYEIITF